MAVRVTVLLEYLLLFGLWRVSPSDKKDQLAVIAVIWSLSFFREVVSFSLSCRRVESVVPRAGTVGELLLFSLFLYICDVHFYSNLTLLCV